MRRIHTFRNRRNAAQLALVWIAITCLALVVCQPTRLPAADPAANAAKAKELLAEARRKAAQSRALFDLSGRSAGTQPILQVEPVARMEAVYTETRTYPNASAEAWSVFGPKPIDLPGQRRVTTTMSPAPAEIGDLGFGGRRLFAARFPAGRGVSRNSVTVRLEFKAELLSRHLVPRPAKDLSQAVAPPSRIERELALTASQTIDYAAPEFQNWLDQKKLRPVANETELDFARRVFLWIRTNYTYEYTGEMDRQSSHVCLDRKADCGGLSNLLCAVLRANDIPARPLVGRWARSSIPGLQVGTVDFSQEHVKAEFFITGIGWVPADLTLAIRWDWSASGLGHFGQDPGDFFAMHTGEDFTVEVPGLGRKSLLALQTPAYFYNGSGTTDGSTVTRKWEVRLWPLDKQPTSAPDVAR